MQNFSQYIPILIVTTIAYLAVKWIYFKILRIAFDKNLVDSPGARKLQKAPIPVMGGIAAYFGVLVGIWVSVVLFGASIHLLLPVVCAMSVMLYVGAMDDILGLSPIARFIIEILTILGLIFSNGMCLDNFRGLWGVYELSWWIAVPLTVVAGVGIINAINMIDGVNGLSSGLCIIYCLFFGTAFIKEGDFANAVLAFTTIGALAPFYIHNVFGLKSRMFIGDAGTMVIGLLLTWFTISLLNSNSAISYLINAQNVNLIALALAILSVPIFDTLRVMGMRIARKKSPFHPDKTHLHHVFINVGVSHFITSVSEIIIDVVIVGLWGGSVLCGFSLEVQLYVVIFASICLVWGTYCILRYNAVRHTKFLHRLTAFSVKTHLGRKEWWKTITEFLDAPGELFYDNLGDTPIVRKGRLDNIDPNNIKELDRKKIVEFMRGRAEVMVQDIIDNSGAENHSVFPIIFEEVQAGYMKIIREGNGGAPDIITLTDKK